MEINPENSSEPTIAKPLTNGYQRALRQKLARMRASGSRWETRIFQRFYKVPTILSNALCLVFIMAMVAVAVITQPRSLHWSLIALGFALWVIAGVLVGLFAKFTTLRIMVRKRLWLWGKNKFNSWEEFGDWFAKTDAMHIEFLAGEEDDSWLPLPDGGSREVQDWDQEQ